MDDKLPIIERESFQRLQKYQPLYQPANHREGKEKFPMAIRSSVSFNSFLVRLLMGERRRGNSGNSTGI